MNPPHRLPRIGLFMTKLSAEAPRGVTRVARAIAEVWARGAGVELLALSDPLYHQHDIIFHACPMAEWLEKNPLVRAPGSAPPPAESHPAMSINDIDAIVSFECYDPIWDWPTELHSCRMLGMFSDAIPFRINEGTWWNPGGYYRALAKMVNRAHSIFCISQATLRDLVSFFPNARSKGFVAYCGHDRDRFLPPEDPEEETRIADQPRSRVRTIAMIGEVEPRKNQAGVLRACRHLQSSAEGDRLRLLLIGRRDEKFPYQALEEQARQFVAIEYTDYIPDEDLASTLRQCDVFLFPSLWEGFGIPILEAMTAGVPVVTSDVASLPEVGGQFAFYCDPYDPLSIARAVTSAIRLTPKDRARLLESARDWAGTFTWEKMKNCLEGQIFHLISTRALDQAG